MHDQSSEFAPPHGTDAEPDGAMLAATGAAVEAVRAMLNAVAQCPGTDARALAVARTHLETGFLWLVTAAEGGGVLDG